jgi:hypothetical protein
MSIQFDNLKLVDQVNEALITNGLQATTGHKAISEKSLLIRIRFNTNEMFAGEKFQRQLYLLNINDGKHALKMYCGLFRFACSNGLIIPAFDGTAHGLRIVHRDCKPTHEKLNQLPDLIMNGIEAIATGTADLIESARAIQIPTETSAISVIGNLSVSDNVKDHAIRSWFDRTRPEDTPNNAWSLFNVVNESIRLVHGNLTRTAMQQKTNLYTDVLDLSNSLISEVA